MRTYVTIYRDRKYLVEAETTYAAQKLAMRFFGLTEKNRYKISVFVADGPISTAAL